MAYVKPKTFGSETLGGIWHNPNIGWFNKTLRTGLAGVGKANQIFGNQQGAERAYTSANPNIASNPKERFVGEAWFGGSKGKGAEGYNSKSEPETEETETDSTHQSQPWSGGGSYSDTARNQAYLRQQMNRFPSIFSNMDQDEANKLSWMNQDYNRGLNSLNQSWGRARQDHKRQTDRRLTDRQRQLGATDDEFKSQSDAYDRYFNMNKAGNSSASQILAPTILGKAATKQRNQIEDTNAENALNQNLAYGRAEEDYKNSLDSLNRDSERRKQDTRSQYASRRAAINEQRAGLEQQLAQARGKSYAEALAASQPYITKADALSREAVDLGKVRNPLEVKNFEYQTPDKKDFRVDKIESNITDPNNKDGSDMYSRYFKDQEEKKKRMNAISGYM